MTSEKRHDEIDLGCRAMTPMPDRDERGPLVANDHGICVVIGRRRLRRTPPIHYYFFAWSDAIGYRLTPSTHSESGASVTTAAHESQLTIYTRREQYSWELPLSDVKVRALLGRWLARIPSVA
jgi:hypothetical protein